MTRGLPVPPGPHPPGQRVQMRTPCPHLPTRRRHGPTASTAATSRRRVRASPQDDVS